LLVDAAPGDSVAAHVISFGVLDFFLFEEDEL